MADSLALNVSCAFPFTVGADHDLADNLVSDSNAITVMGTGTLSATGGVFGTGCLVASNPAMYIKLQSVMSSAYGDFTLEALVRYDSITGTYQAIVGAGSAADGGNANGTMIMRDRVPMIWYNGEALKHPVSIDLGRFYHFALERVNGVTELYVDGVPTGQPINTGTVAFLYSFIGSDYYSKSTSGVINCVRMTVGVARYKGPFTPPNKDFVRADYAGQIPVDQGDDSLAAYVAAHYPFMQTDDPVYGINYGYLPTAVRIQAPQIFKTGGRYGTGYLYCNGSSANFGEFTQYISVGTGDFTIEAYVNFDEVPPVAPQVVIGSANTNRGSLALLNQVAGVWFAPGMLCTQPFATAGKTVHLCFERYNGVMEVYVNGRPSGNPSTVAAGEEILYRYIGTDATSSLARGKIFDVRFTVGVARYKGPFTVGGRIKAKKHAFSFVQLEIIKAASAPVNVKPTVVLHHTQKKLTGIPYGGLGQVYGTVSANGTPNIPLSRRVRLYCEKDGRQVDETWSNTAGEYRFKYINPALTYSAIAYDHNNEYRAVIANGLTPEVIK